MVSISPLPFRVSCPLPGTSRNNGNFGDAEDYCPLHVFHAWTVFVDRTWNQILNTSPNKHVFTCHQKERKAADSSLEGRHSITWGQPPRRPTFRSLPNLLLKLMELREGSSQTILWLKEEVVCLSDSLDPESYRALYVITNTLNYTQKWTGSHIFFNLIGFCIPPPAILDQHWWLTCFLCATSPF